MCTHDLLAKAYIFQFAMNPYRHWAIAYGVITPPHSLTHSFHFLWVSLSRSPVISSFSGSVSLPTHLENTAIAEVIVSQWMVITFGIKCTSEHRLELQQPCPLAACLLQPFKLVSVEFKHKAMAPNGWKPLWSFPFDTHLHSLHSLSRLCGKYNTEKENSGMNRTEWVLLLPLFFMSCLRGMMDLLSGCSLFPLACLWPF